MGGALPSMLRLLVGTARLTGLTGLTGLTDLYTWSDKGPSPYIFLIKKKH